MDGAKAIDAGLAGFSRPSAPWWLVGWALASALLIAGFGADALRLDFSEPDNTMRLVQVRDLLGGQGWFDNIQHRLNPPEGVPSHWARWIDAIIAAPIALLTPLLGPHAAEVITAFAWPLALLAAFMLLVARVSRELGGEQHGREAEIAGPIVAALALPTMEKFGPGSFDHHNVELIFAFAAMLGLMRMARLPRMGGLAGLTLGAALATAAEGVPQVLSGVMAGGLLWLFRPDAYRRGLVWLGAGLALASLAFFLTLVPPERWGLRVTDAMSPAFLMIGVVSGGAAILLGAGRWSERLSLARRLVVAAAVGGATLAALVLACPELLDGGYSTLAPEMKQLWMPQISETRSLGQVWADSPGFALGLAGSAIAGAATAAVYLRTRWREANGWIVLAFLGAGWAIFLWQIRGAEMATAFAIPFGAWACVRARAAWKATTGPRGLTVFTAVCAVSVSAVWQGAGAQVQARTATAEALASYASRSGAADACLTREAMAPLATVKSGLIVNPFVTGPAILEWTTHSVVAAPYHRDGQGITMMMDVMRATPDGARGPLASSGADYVLVCPGLPETLWYARHPLAAGGDPAATLSARLARNDAPDWLQRIELGDTPLHLYRILR
jgi:hypothetical protein